MAILVVGDSVAWQTGEALKRAGADVLNGAIGGTGPGRENVFPATSPANWHENHLAGLLIDYWAPTKVLIHWAGANWLWNLAHTGFEVFNTPRWQSLTSLGFIDVVTDDVMSRMDEADVIDISGLPMGPEGYGLDFGHGIDWMGKWVDANWPVLWPDAGHVSLADLAYTDLRYRLGDQIHLTEAGADLVASRVLDVLAIPAAPLPPADDDPVHVYVVTEKYRRTVAESHERIVRAEVLLAGDDDALDLELGIIGGSVSFDAQNATQTTGRLDAVDVNGTLDADTAEQLLNPFTTEIRLSGGVRHPDGSTETFPLGVLPVTQLDLAETDGALSFEMTLMDRSINAQRPFGRPYVIAPGTAFEDAARDLIWSQAPLTPVDLPATGYVTPLLVLSETSNPWAEATKLMLMAGYTLFLDRTGRLSARTVAVGASAVAQWRFEEGTRSNYWNPRRSMYGGQVANHIVVRSKANASVWGEAFDADPASPSYVGGPYRDRTKTVVDERVTTEEQATRAAEALLAAELGPATVVPVTAIPNAALALDDTATLIRAVLGLDTFTLVDAFEYPFLADTAMPVRLRRSILTESPEQLRVVA